MTIKIEEKWCKGCAICVYHCPHGVLGVNEVTGKAEVFHKDQCVGCGICERVCPDLAIESIRGVQS